jgi:pyridoxal phosphate enzyme (YggS family)
MSIAENIAHVRERIEAAVRRASRPSGEIKLIAVTKMVGPETIRLAYDAGVRIFGENRVQEFAAKKDAVGDLDGAQWHMIGHLQTNKAAKALELFSAIDSVDSLRLAEKLNSAALQLGRIVPVLIEINIAGEVAKSGVAPDSAELDELLKAAPELPQIRIRGLMTVPPYSEDVERSRPYFREMRSLRADIAGGKFPAVDMGILSMGMSHDFEIAIEEGATCVRIGTAIFGERRTARKND